MKWEKTIISVALEQVRPLRDSGIWRGAVSVPKRVSSQRPGERQANNFQDELRPPLPWSYAGGRRLC